MSEGPTPGVKRIQCHECDGFDDYLPDGGITQVHEEGCSNWIQCECDEEDCPECFPEHDISGEDIPDEAFAVALRLLIGAADRDDDAVVLALSDIPECQSCERQIWYALLRVFEEHSTADLADHLRGDLLRLLDGMGSPTHD